MTGELAKMYTLQEIENATKLRQQTQKEELNYIFPKQFVLFVVRTLKRG
jgi:hypothetical protein